MNKKKARIGAFSGHCKTSRRFVDSSVSVTISLASVPIFLNDVYMTTHTINLDITNHIWAAQGAWPPSAVATDLTLFWSDLLKSLTIEIKVQKYTPRLMGRTNSAQFCGKIVLISFNYLH